MFLCSSCRIVTRITECVLLSKSLRAVQARALGLGCLDPQSRLRTMPVMHVCRIYLFSYRMCSLIECVPFRMAKLWTTHLLLGHTCACIMYMCSLIKWFILKNMSSFVGRRTSSSARCLVASLSVVRVFEN